MSAKNDMIMAALESAKIKFDRLTMGDKEMILNIVDFACEAQRNACIREFRRYSKVNEYEISENWARAISMSKIERQDYE